MADTVNEVIKENKAKALKGQPLSKKISYIFYYYKWHFVIGAVVIWFLCTAVYNIATAKDPYIQVAVVNGYGDAPYQEFMDEYIKTTDMDPESERASIDYTYYIDNSKTQNGFDNQQIQKLFAATTTGQLDLIICDESNFEWIAGLGYFKDLKDVLSDEMLDEYKDSIIEVSIENDVNGSVSSELSGIDITDSKYLRDGRWYPGGRIYIGIVNESTVIDRDLDFIQYIAEK